MPKLTYVIKVELVGGPVSRAFLEANPRISRTIEVRGNQTLHDLHEAIFSAFDRYDEHLYEFQMGKKPMAKNARTYQWAPFGDALEMPFETGDPERAKFDKLDLRVGQVFWYWFDFGDDWWHKLTVKAIGQAEPKARYPRVTAAVGDSPPQYPDWEEEEDGDEDDEA